MPGMPRGRSGRARRRRLWDRKAVQFRRAALGCYAAAVALAVVVFLWSPAVWPGIAAVLLAGLWCERGAAFARRLAERDENRVKADVPGD